jgi:hypothetical protein
MVTKSKLAKLSVTLGIKGILIIVCLASVTTALVTYSTNVTISPFVQLTQGHNSVAWEVIVNEVNEPRYIPGDNAGYSEVTLDTSNSSTYCFKVTTDAMKVCAVKIELGSAVSSSSFSQFEMTVYSSTGGAWSSETIYSNQNGGTTKAYIDGLTPSDAGYIHQANSATKYYEVKVTYSCDAGDSGTQIPVTLVLTPLPMDNFS